MRYLQQPPYKVTHKGELLKTTNHLKILLHLKKIVPASDNYAEPGSSLHS